VWWLGLVLLVGLSACGSPAPEAPLSGRTPGETGAVVSPPADHTAQAPASQDRTQTTTLGAPAPPGPFRPETARITQAAPPDEQTPADQAQRQTRERWYAEMREAPEAGMRLYALDLWAQQPTEAIDPVTYALVDEEESVRTKAQELYEQHLVREAAPPPKHLDAPASASPTLVGQKGL
jgi:hypothetical protein